MSCGTPRKYKVVGNVAQWETNGRISRKYRRFKARGKGIESCSTMNFERLEKGAAKRDVGCNAKRTKHQLLGTNSLFQVINSESDKSRTTQDTKKWLHKP